jgi:hypothetical protein
MRVSKTRKQFNQLFKMAFPVPGEQLTLNLPMPENDTDDD